MPSDIWHSEADLAILRTLSASALAGAFMRRWSRYASDYRDTRLRVPAQLLEEARSLDLNISQACELGLKSAIASIRAQQSLVDNRASLEASRQYVEENGLPLADYRNF